MSLGALQWHNEIRILLKPRLQITVLTHASAHGKTRARRPPHEDKALEACKPHTANPLPLYKTYQLRPCLTLLEPECRPAVLIDDMNNSCCCSAGGGFKGAPESHAPHTYIASAKHPSLSHSWRLQVACCGRACSRRPPGTPQHHHAGEGFRDPASSHCWQCNIALGPSGRIICPICTL